MSETTPSEDQHHRIRREARSIGASLSQLGAWARERWRESRWFRLGGYALGLFLALCFLGWILIARGLPSAEKLLCGQMNKTRIVYQVTPPQTTWFFR